MRRDVFHEGEREVQRRAGVEHMASRVGASIRNFMPLAAQEFLRGQPMLVVGGSDDDGAVWASLLSGPAGFASAIDDTRVRVDVMPSPGDPLRITAPARIGLLAVELATRRRLRVNGTVSSVTSEGFVVDAEEVFSNCPKYIQARVAYAGEHSSEAAKHDGDALSDAQRAWVEGADTFFIATRHPVRGSDASHRGGAPGFVRVAEDGSTLTWPDYAGNMMFQTLGNLAIDDRAGLLFVDFDSGSTLQLTGRAAVDWSGAERVIAFRVERAVEIANATSLRFVFVEYSPSNPAT